MSLWCPFLDPLLTAYLSDVSIHIVVVLRLGTFTLDDSSMVYMLVFFTSLDTQRVVAFVLVYVAHYECFYFLFFWGVFNEIMNTKIFHCLRAILQ